jgi:Protein of unknown function (DUF2917)
MRLVSTMAGYRAGIAAQRCLGIDDRAGCTLWVVEGQVWITVEGHLRDMIANTGDAITLQQSGRTYVSAFRDAVVLIAPVTDPRDVAFAMREAYGLRTLSVTVDLGVLATTMVAAAQVWTSVTSAFVAFARRRFLAKLAAV